MDNSPNNRKRKHSDAIVEPDPFSNLINLVEPNNKINEQYNESSNLEKSNYEKHNFVFACHQVTNTLNSLLDKIQEDD